jgi:hypothetical protein
MAADLFAEVLWFQFFRVNDRPNLIVYRDAPLSLRIT